jgi:hypothetical protein
MRGTLHCLLEIEEVSLLEVDTFQCIKRYSKVECSVPCLLFMLALVNKLVISNSIRSCVKVFTP